MQYEWKAVCCPVCRLPVRKDYTGVLYEGLQLTPPGPHSADLNPRTMAAYEMIASEDMFGRCCPGSEIPGPVIAGSSSEPESFDDDDYYNSQEGPFIGEP